MFHESKKRSKGNIKKLKRKKLDTKYKNIPGIFGDLKRCNVDPEPYIKATEKEFQNLLQREVMKLVRREKLDKNILIGKCTVLLTTKRSGKIKSRCVFNGGLQKRKLLKYFRSPTLHEDTLKYVWQ